MRLELRAGRFRLTIETGRHAERAPSESGPICYEPAPSEDKDGPLYVPPTAEACLAFYDMEEGDDG